MILRYYLRLRPSCGHLVVAVKPDTQHPHPCYHRNHHHHHNNNNSSSSSSRRHNKMEYRAYLLSDLVVSLREYEAERRARDSSNIAFYGKKWVAMLICACTCTASAGNNGAPHGELGPGTQVVRWKVL